MYVMHVCGIEPKFVMICQVLPCCIMEIQPTSANLPEVKRKLVRIRPYWCLVVKNPQNSTQKFFGVSQTRVEYPTTSRMISQTRCLHMLTHAWFTPLQPPQLNGDVAIGESFILDHPGISVVFIESFGGMN